MLHPLKCQNGTTMHSCCLDLLRLEGPELDHSKMQWQMLTDNDVCGAGGLKFSPMPMWFIQLQVSHRVPTAPVPATPSALLDPW